MSVFERGPSREIELGSGTVSHTGNTVETALASILIPGGAMNLNGEIVVQTFAFGTSSANAKAVRIKHHSAAGTSGTAFGTASPTTGFIRTETMFANNNAANAQVGTSNTAPFSTNTALGAGVLDTSADSYVNITGQHTLGTESLTVRYCVLLRPRA